MVPLVATASPAHAANGPPSNIPAQKETNMRDPHAIEAFCQAYANTGNATSAFIAANPKAAAWKRRSAARKAVDVMRRSDVQARIAELSDLIRAQATKAFIAQLEDGAEERRRSLVSGILATLSGHKRV